MEADGAWRLPGLRRGCLLLAVPTIWLKRSRHFAVVAPALILACDLAFNNGPNESTALPPANYEMLKPNCTQRDHPVFEGEAATDSRIAMARPGRTRRAGLRMAERGARARLRRHAGLQSLPSRRTSRRRRARATTSPVPTRRHSRRSFPPTHRPMADLLGMRFIAVGDPIEQIDHKLRPGRFEVRRPHVRCLHL